MGFRPLLVAIGALIASAGLWLAVDAIDVWIVGSVSRCGLGPGYAVAAVLALAGWLFLGRTAPASPGPPTMHAFARWALMAAVLELGASALLTQCADTKAQGYSAAMRNDLRNLVILERRLHADSGRYTVAPNLPLSPGTTDLAVTLTADGWTASVGGRSLQTCAIYVGSTKKPPAVTPEEPRCTPPRLGTADLLSALGILSLGAVLALLGVVIRRSPALERS